MNKIKKLLCLALVFCMMCFTAISAYAENNVFVILNNNATFAGGWIAVGSGDLAYMALSESFSEGDPEYQTPQEYTAEYSVTISEDGIYNLFGVTSPLASNIYSTYSISVDGGGYIAQTTGNTTVTATPMDGDSDTTVVDLEQIRYAPMTLSKGAHTITFKVTEPTAAGLLQDIEEYRMNIHWMKLVRTDNVGPAVPNFIKVDAETGIASPGSGNSNESLRWNRGDLTTRYIDGGNYLQMKAAVGTIPEGGVTMTYTVNIAKAGWYEFKGVTSALFGNVGHSNYKIKVDDKEYYSARANAQQVECFDVTAAGSTAINLVNHKYPDEYLTEGAHTIIFKIDELAPGPNRCIINFDYFTLERIASKNFDKIRLQGELGTTTAIGGFAYERGDISTSLGHRVSDGGLVANVKPALADSNTPEESVTINFNAPRAGLYDMQAVTSNFASTDHSPYNIEINGMPQWQPSDGAAMLKNVSNNNNLNLFKYKYVELEEGDNQIKFNLTAKASTNYYTGRWNFILDYVEFTRIDEVDIKLQGESAAAVPNFSKARSSQQDSEFADEGHYYNFRFGMSEIDNQDVAEYKPSVTFTVDAPVDGVYEFSAVTSPLNQNIGWLNNKYYIKIDNGDYVDATEFIKSAGEVVVANQLVKYSYQDLFLTAGTHTISFMLQDWIYETTAETAAPDRRASFHIDYMRLYKTSKGGISNITFENGGNAVSNINGQTAVDVIASVTNSSDDDVEYSIIAALYSQGGQLLNCKVITDSFDYVAVNEPLKISAFDVTEAVAGSYIKAFVWHSTDTAQPASVVYPLPFE